MTPVELQLANALLDIVIMSIGKLSEIKALTDEETKEKMIEAKKVTDELKAKIEAH